MTTRMRQDSVDLPLDYKTIPEAITLLRRLLEEYGDEAVIDISVEWDYGSELATSTLKYQRPWTEEELDKDLKQKEEQEKRDRAQWERLAKTYGVVGNGG